MKNNAPKNGTSGINIQVPRGWFRIEETQFRDLSSTPIGTRDLDILIEDGKKNLSGEFDVHSEFAVNSHLLQSNKEHKNRVFTLEKRENKKDKTVSYWFVPVNPGKTNKEYPAFVLQRVVLPELPKTSRLVARMRKTARNILLPLGTAATIAWASVAVKETLNYREVESGDKLKYTIVEDPAIQKQPTINIVEIPSTENVPTAPEEEIEVEKPEEIKNIYKVKKWDTMSGIAKHFNVALKTLLTLNNLTEDSVIEVGQEINLGDLVKPEEKKLAAWLTKKEHVALILAECDRQKVSSKAQIAYILATAEHESWYFTRMIEKADWAQYDWRKVLWNTEPGDGEFFKWKGYVQLTGRAKYTLYDGILKKEWLLSWEESILKNPELVTKPEIAVFILVHGMINGKFGFIKIKWKNGETISTKPAKLWDFINEKQQDWEGARYTVNGQDKKEDIAKMAQEILKTL